MQYLDAVAVSVAMPPLDEQLRLAERALLAVDVDGEVPGKVSVHPGADSSIAYAMPASLRSSDGRPDSAVGMKWVTIFPGNSARGLPTVNSVILLNDPETLAPAAVMDGSAITAARTAAVSGVAVARLAPACAGRPLRIALIGAGVQGRSHVPMLGHVAPGHLLTVYDRHPERAEELAAAATRTRGIAGASTAPTAQRAIEEADIVVTAASFGPIRQAMTNSWLRPDALVVSVDYEMYASSKVARTASVFLVDEVRGFLNSRADGRFEGFPDPSGTLGAFIRSGAGRPEGRVLVAHLGMGLSDIVFAAAVSDRARVKGLGLELPSP
jgi:ornithine cyclodeaminase/alanine dehydrogenase-like protein (mu-crystallin family)